MSSKKKAGATALPSLTLVSHFIGASPNSTDVRKMLFRICTELQSKLRLACEVPEEYKDLKKAFPKILKEASFQGRVVIVIDGLNQLDSTFRAHSLDWLPTRSPVKIIVSTVEDHPTYQVLQRRRPPVPVLTLSPLDLKDRQSLVRFTLAEYHKKLDEKPMNNQMQLLLKKSDAVNPLYLVLACEELRVFGVYEKLTDRIKSLSPTLSKLLDEVLIRLEMDHGKALIANALSCIVCARGGVREADLVRLLRRNNTEEELPAVIWARLLRALSPFLRPIAKDADATEATLSLLYHQMQLTITHRYLEKDGAIKTHRMIAEYYLQRKGDAIAISELPYHLAQAHMWKELDGLLTDLSFIESKCALGLSHDLVSDYAEALTPDKAAIWGGVNSYSFSGEASVAKVKEFWRFVAGSVHVISRRPHLVFQQAANQPSTSAPAAAASARWQKKDEKRAWMRWVNKPQVSDTCKMTINSFSDPVMACAYSPDGTRVACASRDCTIRVFDTATGAEISMLVGHTNWVVSCCFAPNGRMLASASFDETLKLWDVTLGSEMLTMKGHTSAVSACCFSPDGKDLVSGGWDTSIRMWDTITGKELKKLNGHTKPVNSVAYSNDGKMIASTGWDGTVRVWNAKDAKELKDVKATSVMIGHEASVRSVKFSPNSKQIVSASVDHTVCLWDAHAAKLITTIGRHSKPATSCAYSTDGKLLASTSDDGTVKIWAAVLGRQLTQTNLKSGWMNCVAFSSDDRRVVTGTSDCTLKIWDTSSNDLVEIRTLTGHSRTVSSVVFSPDNQLIASSSDDTTIRIWDAESGRQLAVLEGHRDCVASVAFSPDGERIASASDDFTVRLWDVSKALDGSDALIADMTGHSNTVRSVAFSPDGSRLASASRDNNIRVWDARTGKFKTQLSGHLDWINCISFAPNSRHLVSSAWDFNLKVWDVKKGCEVSTMKGHTASVEACAFTQDSNMVISCGYDNTIRVWDAAAGTEITCLTGHTNRINGISISSDNRVASVSDDGSFRIWNPTAGLEVATLVGHSNSVRDATFSPAAASMLTTVADDSTVKIWDVGQEEEATQEHHSAWVNVCTFSQDGKLMATASDDGTVKIWDPKTAQCVRTLGEGTSPVKSCALLPNGGVVYTQGSALFMVDDNRNSTALIGHTNEVVSCASHPKKNWIASAGWDCTVRLWDDLGRELATLEGHSDWVNIVTFSPSGRYIASGGRDNRILLWEQVHDSATYHLKCNVSDHSNWISSLSFSEDENLLVSGSYDNTANVWYLSNSTLTCRSSYTGHTGPVSGTAFSPNGGRVFSTSHDGALHLWDSQTSEISSEFVHAAPPSTLAFSANARCLAVGDSIGKIYILQYVRKQ